MLDKDLPKRGDVVAGKYQIDGILGSGGMGAVFQVTHRVTGKAFAIKWLLPRLSAESDAVKRFIREAQVAGRVDHPNVVEVYDVGQEGSSFFMVMELLQGESLASRMSAKGRLSATEIAQILIPVTRGLAAAHKAGVIHRDLKPDNIFLCRTLEGTDLPKVLDFGISKMSSLDSALSTGITRHGAVMGTPNYMSPEQVRALPVDARTDVYALGVILYQALSGHVPFIGDSYGDLVVKIMSESPKPLAEVARDTPPKLVQLVERAMAREPAQRPGTALEFGLALQEFASGMRFDSSLPSARSEPQLRAAGPQTQLSTESHVPPMPSRMALWLGSRTGRAVVGAVTGCVLAVIGVGLYDLALSKPEQAPAGSGSRQVTIVMPKPEVAVPQPEASPEPPQAATDTLEVKAVASAEDPLPVIDTVRLDAGARPPSATAEPARVADAVPSPSPPPKDQPAPPTAQQAKILPKAKPTTLKLAVPTPAAPPENGPNAKPEATKPGRTTKLSVNDFM